jgi:hypothetical protein
MSFAPLLVQLKQPRQNLVFSELACPPVITPAVGFRHRFIQRLVGIVQPSRACVVEFGEARFLSS